MKTKKKRDATAAARNKRKRQRVKAELGKNGITSIEKFGTLLLDGKIKIVWVGRK